jgi:predicted DNA-binding protein YlxM (UPF0122 family)
MTKASNDYYAKNKVKLLKLAKEKRAKNKAENEDIYNKGHNTGSALLNTLVDSKDYFKDINELVIKNDMWSYLKGTLTDRECTVLHCRYVLDETLKEVAEKFNVCVERIRQIEGKALRKCRHPTRSWQLMLFLNPEHGQRMMEERIKAEAKRKDDLIVEIEVIKRESAKRRKAKKLARQETDKARILEYYAKRDIEEKAEREWKERNKERLKRIRDNKEWWFEQRDTIRYMIDLNLPLVEYVGRCSCRKWKYEYQISVLGFECLCERCGDRFMMRKGNKDEG